MPTFSKTNPIQSCTSLDRLNDTMIEVLENATRANITRPEYKDICFCFLDSINNITWPCYPYDKWEHRLCEKCKPSGNCFKPSHGQEFDEAHLENAPCLCQDITHMCVVKPSPLFDPTPLWKHPEPTPKPADQITEAEEEAKQIDNYGFGEISDPSAMNAKAQENTAFMMAELEMEDRINMSYSREEQIKTCSFMGRDCDIEKDFRIHVDPGLGNCYTFNYNHSEAHMATRPGSLYGLRLLIFSNKTDYLPTTESSGVKIAIHHQMDYPFPDTFGYNAPTGFLTSFGVRKQKLEHLPSPYGDCMERKDYNATEAGFLYGMLGDDGNGYSVEGCQRSCRQHILIKECKCADARYPIPEGSKTCTADDQTSRNCLEQMTEQISKDTAEGKKLCECRQPCDVTVFSATFSTAMWPTESAKDTLCSQEMPNCIEIYKEQAAFVEVFFEQVNYQLLKEHEAYGFVNLLSDFGGQISLWLGFSVITGIEVTVLFIQLLKACCCGNRRLPRSPPPEPSVMTDLTPRFPSAFNGSDTIRYADGSSITTVKS